MNLQIKFKKLHEDAVIPQFAKPGDAGLDIRSMEYYTLLPGLYYQFKTGLAIEIPAGHVALVNGRSGLAVKNGIDTIGNVIDENYRGEFSCILYNMSKEILNVKKGDRIAQLLIMPVLNNVEVVEAGELSETNRGTDGFGSTGVN